MRRIFACILVLGIAALGGVGVMRCIAQSESPIMPPEPLKPAPLVIPADPAVPISDTGVRAQFKAPDIVEPNLPAVPETLPALPTGDTAAAPALPPAVVPATPDKTPAVPMLPPASPTEAAAPPTHAAEAPREIKLPAPIEAPAGEASKFCPVQEPNRASPAVSIETVAPESAAYGKPINYEIVVKNIGACQVSHVRVDEELGAGAKFISSEPAAEVSGDRVMWNIGALGAREEKRIRVSVNPGEGDLHSKPRVTYSAETSLCVHVTRPILAVSASIPEKVQVGDEVPLQIHITNSGTGDASRIVLKAILTDGLKHPEGADIQALLCDKNKLAPGASQTVTLRVKAAGAGAQTCELDAMTEGAVKAHTQVKFDIRQPKLTLAMHGPAKCVVTAEPTFTLTVANPGNSPTDPVELAASFPDGLEFQSATDGGTYDPVTRTVSWKSLGAAEAGTRRSVNVKARSTIAGHLAVRAVSQAGPKLSARSEAVIQAEGVPALSFEVVDLINPIEVGKEASYEIRIANTGTMQCTNIRVTATLSDGLLASEALSPVPHKTVGQTLVFEPVAKLPVKGEPLVIRVKAKGVTAGDQRFKVQLSCDQLKQPISKEESTSFFQP